jgi:SAM-dependent methyltransferase
LSEVARSDAVTNAYSEHADAYDMEANQASCWGRLAKVELDALSVRSDRQCVVDVGCGTGSALVSLAPRLGSSTRLIGVEPAPGMLAIARQRTAELPNVSVLEGRFEALPLADQSVDHLFSLLAFHWVRHVDRAIAELRRVLAPGADLDLFFVGAGTGREFIAVTSGIIRRHLGLGRWLASARLRAHLTFDKARELFTKGLPEHEVHVRERVETHFDTLEGHWGWWVRIEGHFAGLEPAARDACYDEIRQAIGSLETDAGIPYTTRVLHVFARAA